MNAPILTLPLSGLPAAPVKKKRVLLVDASRAKRDLRSETMRKLGMEVDCAADIIEARSWWRADLYDLVLLSVESTASREKFCDDIRRTTPQQQIMFLVGKPAYLAAEPGSDQVSPSLDEAATTDSWNGGKTTLEATLPDVKRWGILEACRRISAVRSVSEARTRAIRDRPEQPRDSETSRSTRTHEAEMIVQLTTETAQ